LKYLRNKQKECKVINFPTLIFYQYIKVSKAVKIGSRARFNTIYNFYRKRGKEI